MVVIHVVLRLSSFGWRCVCVSWLCTSVWRANSWQSVPHRMPAQSADKDANWRHIGQQSHDTQSRKATTHTPCWLRYWGCHHLAEGVCVCVSWLCTSVWRANSWQSVPHRQDANWLHIGQENHDTQTRKATTHTLLASVALGVEPWLQSLHHMCVLCMPARRVNRLQTECQVN